MTSMFRAMTQFAYLIRQKANSKSSNLKITQSNGNVSKTYIHSAASIKYDIYDYENNAQKTLTDEQSNAVTMTILSPVSVITGGPGRGKTCIVDCIATIWLSYNSHTANNIILLAPTGKAMNKLKTDTKAKFNTWTIDHMIMTAAPPGCTKLNYKFIQPINTDDTLIIIDESSMVDLVKAVRLISLFPNARYCFVGDVDQLPPIDPGYILKDMIDSGDIPVSRLTVPLRNRGTILENADRINSNDINLQYNFNDMPFYPQAEDDDAALNAIIEQYNEERNNCSDISQIALLCPTKKGAIGTTSLNIAIQNQACPENKTASDIYDQRRNQKVYIAKGYPIPNTIYGTKEHYTRFRVGDIVMNNKNKYDIDTFTYKDNDYWNGDAISTQHGIFNGECGRIIAYIPFTSLQQSDENASEYVVVQFFDGRIATIDITNGDFESFDLGYALTVHKSQGCEYETVIYISPKSMLNYINLGFANKNLVYTAVTRAKNRVVIMGSKESLNACIQTNAPERKSNLKKRLSN